MAELNYTDLENWQGNLKKHTSNNPILKLINGRFYKDILESVRTMKPTSIIDVGCGEGFISNKIQSAFKESTLLGIDLNEKYIEFARRSFPNVSFAKKNLFTLTEKYDLVLCTEVLEHLENPENALEKLVQISKKYVFVSVPNEPWFRIANILRLKYLSDLGNTPGHINQNFNILGYGAY
jgi:2-polyprenyl-3-methyl-5-hydroxy-6-metoxy-1,4-benzoquinol methylase